MQPLIERDLYGKAPTAALSRPNLPAGVLRERREGCAGLEFRPAGGSDGFPESGQFYLDGEKDQVVAGPWPGTWSRSS